MNINLSSYYKWLYTTKDTIASMNHYIALDKNGNIYFLDELTDEMKKINLLKEKMQYKFLYK